jgi:NAD(P)-dependent dehydrogenase (short-subunit alcohol dehydrogenase family)
MVSVLVTGTNQGIGLGLIRQLAKRSDIHHIFATVRDPESSGTADLKRLASRDPAIHIVKLELNESSIAVYSFQLQFV